MAVLDGDPETRQVFADLLEEAGDVRRAQWLREAKRGSRNRLDFVLGILPPKTAVALACDFAEHGMRSTVSRRLQSIVKVRTWMLRTMSPEKLDRALKTLRDAADDLRSREGAAASAAADCLASLGDAADHARRARRSQRQGDFEEAETHARRARGTARVVANRARRVRVQEAWTTEVNRWIAAMQRERPGVAPRFSVGPDANQAELAWQLAATREVVVESLDADG